MINSLQLSALLSAIAIVESGNNPKAIGDRGRAVGAYQIHPEVVIDFNMATRSHHLPADMFNPRLSRDVATWYLRHYGEAAKATTPEQLARIWNGGPKGHHKAATKKYWAKVRPHYEKLCPPQPNPSSGGHSDSTPGTTAVSFSVSGPVTFVVSVSNGIKLDTSSRSTSSTTGPSAERPAKRPASRPKR